MESAEALDDIDSGIASCCDICEACLHAASLGVPEEKACQLLKALGTKGHDIAEAAVYPVGELLRPEEVFGGSALLDVSLEIFVEFLWVLHFVYGGLMVPFQCHFLSAAFNSVDISLSASAEEFEYSECGIIDSPALVARF